MHRAIDHADLVINVGHDVVEKPFFMQPGGKKVIHVNFSRRGPVLPQHEVVEDIANSVEYMAENCGIC